MNNGSGFLFRIPLLLVCLVVQFATVTLAGDILSRSERDYLDLNSPVVFVSQTTYPPFEFIDPHGDRSGMTIELVRWMATEMGFRARFTDTSFQEAQERILSGSANVLTSFFYSKRRDELFDFTDVLFQVPATIFVAVERPDIKSIEDLNGKSIAMQKGDYALEYLRLKKIEFSVVYTKNFAEATNLVIAGKADAIIGDEQIVMYHLFSSNLTQYVKKVGKPLYIGQNCMSVQEGNLVLRSILNKGIILAKETGALDRIRQKWLGSQIAVDDSIITRYQFEILGALAAMFLSALFIWIIHIRRSKASEQESRENFQTFFNSIDNFLFILDDQGCIMEVNQVVLDRLGYSMSELRSQSVLFVHPDDRQEEAGEIVAAMLAGERESCPVPLIAKDGKLIPVETYVTRGSWNKKPALFGVSKDISKLKQSEEKFAKVFHNSPVIAGLSSLETGCYTEVNQAFFDKLGFTPEEVIGKSAVEVLKMDPEFREKTVGLLKQNLQVRNLETQIQAKDGSTINVLLSADVIELHDGSYNFTSAVDITHRKKAEQELVLERRRLADIIRGTNVGTWEWNVQTGETVFNERWANIIGYTLDEIAPVSIDTWMSFCHSDDLEVSNELLAKHFSGESDYYECEARMKHKNGEWIWVLDRGRVATWTDDGKPLLMSGTHQDISTTKLVEKRMRDSLREKETLLQEIHHRVKNNLAVISSLLNLQAINSENPELQSALTDSQSRIQSMSAIHETLYESGDLSSINLKDYIAKLARFAVDNYMTQTARIKLDLRIESVVVDVKQASPLGLLINELISNSAKHAFPGDKQGRISIDLHKSGGDGLELVYRDDGVGFPDNLDWRNTESMGINLVRILTEGQLKGTVELGDEPGTTFIIRFDPQKNTDGLSL